MRVVEVDGPACRADIERLHTDLFGGGRSAVPLLHKGYWWLAYEGGEVVAFAGLVHSSHYQKTGYLCRAGVAGHSQGQGIQKKLIRARVAKARRLGWHFAMCDTHTRNPASANSLISCGFKMFVPFRKWNGRDHVYWQRRI